MRREIQMKMHTFDDRVARIFLLVNLKEKERGRISIKQPNKAETRSTRESNLRGDRNP
jgi:hypothetical protein